MMKYNFARQSPVRVCFTGKSRAGAWEIRGRQISKTRLNWECVDVLNEKDFSKFDLVCFVKKPSLPLLEQLHAAKKPMCYDIVDSWAQPDDNSKCSDRIAAQNLFEKKWKSYPFFSYIFPNRTMQADLSGLTPHYVTIYHHYRPCIEKIKVNQDVKRIGYEGNVAYLGEWQEVMERICDQRGFEFVTNPDDFSSIDIGFAARGGIHNCFLANRYKSNVKLANFIGAGMPCIVSAREMSCHETDPGGVRFFETEKQLECQVDKLLNYDLRVKIHEDFLANRHQFSVEKAADLYDYYFQTVLMLIRQGAMI